jgi:hypothetical protein
VRRTASVSQGRRGHQPGCRRAAWAAGLGAPGCWARPPALQPAGAGSAARAPRRSPQPAAQLRAVLSALGSSSLPSWRQSALQYCGDRWLWGGGGGGGQVLTHLWPCLGNLIFHFCPSVVPSLSLCV